MKKRIKLLQRAKKNKNKIKIKANKIYIKKGKRDATVVGLGDQRITCRGPLILPSRGIHLTPHKQKQIMKVIQLH